MNFTKILFCRHNSSRRILRFSSAFFFARTTLSVNSENSYGRKQLRWAGFWDGAPGFLADPTPQTACSVLGTAPRVFVRVTPNRCPSRWKGLIPRGHRGRSADCRNNRVPPSGSCSPAVSCDPRVACLAFTLSMVSDASTSSVMADPSTS